MEKIIFHTKNLSIFVILLFFGVIFSPCITSLYTTKSIDNPLDKNLEIDYEPLLNDSNSTICNLLYNRYVFVNEKMISMMDIYDNSSSLILKVSLFLYIYTLLNRSYRLFRLGQQLDCWWTS